MSAKPLAPNATDKPTEKQFIAAAFAICDLVPFAPTSEPARELLGRSMVQFVQTNEQLDWLVSAVVNNLRQWAGLAELRAIYATRFGKPTDGEIVTSATTPGFRDEDLEQQFYEREAAETSKKLDQYRAERAALPATERVAIDNLTSTIDQVAKSKTMAN